MIEEQDDVLCSDQIDRELQSLKYELDNNPKLPKNRTSYLIQRMGYLYGRLDERKITRVYLNKDALIEWQLDAIEKKLSKHTTAGTNITNNMFSVMFKINKIIKW